MTMSDLGLAVLPSSRLRHRSHSPALVWPQLRWKGPEPPEANTFTSAQESRRSVVLFRMRGHPFVGAGGPTMRWLILLGALLLTPAVAQARDTCRGSLCFQ